MNNECPPSKRGKQSATCSCTSEASNCEAWTKSNVIQFRECLLHLQTALRYEGRCEAEGNTSGVPEEAVTMGQRRSEKRIHFCQHCTENLQ